MGSDTHDISLEKLRAFADNLGKFAAEKQGQDIMSITRLGSYGV